MALAKCGMIILAQKAETVVSINCITATGAQNPRMGNFQPVLIRTQHGERQERLKCAARAGAIPAFPLASKRQVQQSLSFGYDTALMLALHLWHFLFVIFYILERASRQKVGALLRGKERRGYTMHDILAYLDTLEHSISGLLDE